MIRLDNTTRKLQAVLSALVTTNQLPVLVSWSDKTSSSYDGGSTLINTNGTTAVDIVSAPAASTIRDIDFIAIQNADTAAATVTVRYNDNGTLYTLFKATLEVGDQLTYTHGDGVHLLDSSGLLKSAFTSSIWSTPRNLSLTGDGTATLTGVDGSANVSTGLTLATVNANVGSFGSATVAPVVTVNGKGLVTAASTATITPAVGSITGFGTGVATALGVNVGSAGAPLLVGGTLGNNNLTGIKTATFNGEGTLTTTTGAVTVDWTAAQNYKQNEPTGAITYTFTAPPGVCHLQLRILSDGTSSAYTHVWPASVKWLGVTWAAVANKNAIINFWYDGTNYWAMGSNEV